MEKYELETWAENRNAASCDYIYKHAVNPEAAGASGGGAWEYFISRGIHEFLIPELPAGAYFESGLLYFYKRQTDYCNVVAQASTIIDITLESNFNKPIGEATLPTDWSAVRPVIYLNDDIVAYLNANKGTYIYLITREYDYDFLDVEPASLPENEAFFYPPTDPAFPPDLVLRYRQ